MWGLDELSAFNSCVNVECGGWMSYRHVTCVSERRLEVGRTLWWRRYRWNKWSTQDQYSYNSSKNENDLEAAPFHSKQRGNKRTKPRFIIVFCRQCCISFISVYLYCKILFSFLANAASAIFDNGCCVKFWRHLILMLLSYFYRQQMFPGFLRQLM